MLQPMKERVELLLQSVLGYATVLLLLWGLQWGAVNSIDEASILQLFGMFSEQIAEKNPR